MRWPGPLAECCGHMEHLGFTVWDQAPAQGDLWRLHRAYTGISRDQGVYREFMEVMKGHYLRIGCQV